MSRWFVTIDAGGSQTQLAAFLEDSTSALATVVAGPGNLTLGVEQTIRSCRDGLKRLANSIGRSDPPSGIVMGLAGNQNRQNLDDFIRRRPFDCPLEIVSDGYGHLIGAFAGQPGICLAAGTGSVVTWLNPDQTQGMAGGWSFPIGDHGGGAQIGWAWVQGILDDIDRQHRLPDIGDLPRDRSNWQAWIQSASATQFAALAPAVLEAADLGVPRAVQIIDNAVLDLQRLRTMAPADLPIAVRGSIGVALASRLPWSVAEPKADALSGLRLRQLGLAPPEKLPR